MASLVVQGPGAVQVVSARFQAKNGRPLDATGPDRPAFGHFCFGRGVAEEVVVCRRDDESVELHCHGGHAAMGHILDTLVQAGARPSTWQHWVARQHTDPLTADARIALAGARTERTAGLLLDQFHGALRRAVEAILRLLAENDRAAAGDRLNRLLCRAELGRHLTKPWRVVLAGPANVGKSSLTNALLGYRRAIVHHAPGTTRDVVSDTTAFDGWPVRLADTAGLRDNRRGLEANGIERAEEQARSADLLLLVFDSSQPWSPADAALADRFPGALVVHNKSDLPPRSVSRRPPGLSTSALLGEGVGELIEAIAGRLVPRPPEVGEAVPLTEAQVASLRAAAESLRGDDLRQAAARLRGLISGRPH